jgi:hypothetical protein
MTKRTARKSVTGSVTTRSLIRTNVLPHTDVTITREMTASVVFEAVVAG